MRCVNQLDNNSVSSRVIAPYNIKSSRAECDVIIKGKCDGSRFVAGIERFYIPEEHSMVLDRVIRNSKGKLVVKVDKSGKAVIKDLLINDRPWMEYIKDSE